MIFRRRFDRFRCLDPSRCSKTIEKIIRVSQCLHKEIDASRFSGPEQFSAGAPLILLLRAQIIFQRRFDQFRCLDQLRRSKTIEKCILLAIWLQKEIDVSRIWGPEQFSATAALISFLSAKMIFQRRRIATTTSCRYLFFFFAADS